VVHQKNKMIQHLVIHSTGTEKNYVPEKKEYDLQVSCDIIHFNGQISRYKSDIISPLNKEYYKHIAYIGGKIAGHFADTATWKQYDSLENIVMYHLLYNQHIKISCCSVFFNKCAGIPVKKWLKDIGVNKKNIY
jgi:hypothetical protein